MQDSISNNVEDKKSKAQTIAAKNIELERYLDFLKDATKDHKGYAFKDRRLFETTEIALLDYFGGGGEISITYNQDKGLLTYTSSNSSEAALWEMIRLLAEEVKQFGKSSEVLLKPADNAAKEIMEAACKHYGLIAISSKPTNDKNPMEEMLKQMQQHANPPPNREPYVAPHLRPKPKLS